jgi:hypothetical protein
MSEPTAREVLHTVGAHEGFLEVTDWTTPDDSLVFILARRMERVLELCETVLPGSDRYAQELAASVLRVLDGGEP